MSLLSNTKLLTNDDIDPDSNALELFNVSCNYYLPSEIKNIIDKLEFQNKILVVHINARSLENKLNQVSLITRGVNHGRAARARALPINMMVGPNYEWALPII